MKKIVIVGGGAAGWMTASYLAKFHDDAEVCLIESASIPTIGVGESVTPHVSAFLSELGISKHHWMKHTGAVYKFGNKFTNWAYGKGESEYFSFTYSIPEENYFKDITPVQKITDFKPRRKNSGNRSIDHIAQMYVDGDITRFDQYAHSQFHYMDKNVAPFNNESLILNQPWSFTHHINAELLGSYLKENIALLNGVQHIRATVQDITHTNDVIESLTLDNGQIIVADLFVDCTGFHKKLVKTLGWQQKIYHDHPIKAAWVCQTEYNDPCHEMLNYSESIAEPYGWRFRIGLYHRMGNGYCFSPDHVSEQDALAYFEKQIGPQRRPPKLIKWTPSRLVDFAKGNVVAIGLSTGFVEPMEANQLYNIISGIRRLSNVVKKSRQNWTWDTYNKEAAFAVDDCAEFLLAHYTLTSRQDTEFWRDMKSLGKKLNHHDMILNKIKDPRNSVFESIAGRTLFPDYMWMQMAVAWGHYPTTDLDKTRHDLAKLVINSTEQKHNIVSTVMMNNREWHKKYIFDDIDSGQWEKQYLKMDWYNS
jgi:2-polyprenyl-6-methoxyphenol hydroxylase-like FAD-dependent oxidoreductase